MSGGAVEQIAIVPSWPAPAGVRAASTLRTGGVSAGGYASLNLGAHVGDDPAHVAENRRRVRATLRVPSEPCWLEQVHGTNVLDLDAADRVGAGTRTHSHAVDGAVGGVAEGGAHGSAALAAPADAAVTSRRGVVCVVVTADCVPVLMTDRAGRRVGVAHAGWRGLAAGVLPATAAALGEPGENVLAWLGPAIGPRAFEVGDEVRAAFAAQGFRVERAFARNARGRWHADLYALATESLQRAGVRAVYGGGHCTYTEAARFFSHRRAAPCGRMASMIWID